MMRAIASASVLKFGWRVGIRAEEADPHAEEALHYARKFADDETGPELLMHYGRFKAQMGPADVVCRCHGRGAGDANNRPWPDRHVPGVFGAGTLDERLSVEGGSRLRCRPEAAGYSPAARRQRNCRPQLTASHLVRCRTVDQMHEGPHFSVAWPFR